MQSMVGATATSLGVVARKGTVAGGVVSAETFTGKTLDDRHAILELFEQCQLFRKRVIGE